MKMEIGVSYTAFGIKNVGDYENSKCRFGFEDEDEFLKRLCFSENCVSNDLLGFGESITVNSLPDDPFCMSDWFHENVSSSQSHDQPIDIRSFKMNAFDGLGEEEEVVNLPDDPFCMKNTISDLVDEPIGVGVVDQMLFESFSSELDDVLGEPHGAFEFVLPYLEMKEILAVEGVCRSLRDSVRNEPFFWRTIDFGGSFLTCRVTDDSLLKLTRRAQGKLQSLNLAGCVSITDFGLKQVLATNPLLTKLSVSGCLRLSTAGLLSTLRDLKSSNRLGVKGLITGGTMYFTKEQFKELNLLLGADAKASPKTKKLRLYTSYRSEFSLEDGRVTDLELCPSCEKPGLVFDCPAENCPLKDHPCSKSLCRACVVCVERCHDCGSCLNDCEFMPFCFPFSCVVCVQKRSNQFLECN
ncbi:F-box protein [Cardamine amara subsp. amara]|uniref:F-box protein n=1 Tax=Cardamine amara subsp. amara TaxID=228776 RepID=A0ABD1A1C3_CARAN